MLEIIFGLTIVMLILVFAMVGFFHVLSWFFRAPDQKPKQPVDRPSLSNDVLASRRLIDHLHSKNLINPSAYLKLRDFLSQQFPDQSEAPVGKEPAPAKRASSPVTRLVESKRVRETELGETEPGKPVPPVILPASQRPSLAHQVARNPPAVNAPESVESIVVAEEVSAAQPAPWDLPDPPQPEPLIPRRSFAELMSGFMQEKNMRWGELTSGILIVLSAVGLVVSLREELRDTIPYFSSLLFLLITAAIHGAGIYTFKKWKLRNTSRGTLVIGLLMVPLNFVAACVLSKREPLNEPLLWIAISIGVTAFTFLTWWSSKYLLRRGQLPMTIAIVGCGVGTLLINRAVETTSSSFWHLLLALPVLASFLVGTCCFDARQWVRQRWTVRAANRAFLFLGISAFAILASLTMVLVRVDSKLVGLVAIAPIFSVVCIVTSWIGSVVSQRTGKTAGKPEEKTIRIAALSLKVLGLILLAISLVGSISNPTIFALNALVSALGLMVMFIHQRDEKLVPVAWSVLAFGALVGVNLLVGRFEFDQWSSAEQLKSALLNGKSGLSLLALGVAIAFANSQLQKRLPHLHDAKAFRVRGWITGGGVFLIGCLIALVASLLNRDNVFDVMTASGLLLLGAVALLGVCVVADRKQIAKAVDLPHVAAVFLLGALVHSLLWNPTIATNVASLIGISHAGWIVVLAIASVVLTGLGLGLRPLTMPVAVELGDSEPPPSKTSASRFFVDWAALTTALLSVGAITCVSAQTGWATGFIALAAVCWLLIGWTWTRNQSELAEFAGAPFLVSTAMLTCIAISELAPNFSWFPPIHTGKHWLGQLMGLSVWSIVCSILLSRLERRPSFKWLAKNNLQIDQVVLLLLVFAIGGFVVDSLLPAAAQELSATSTMISQFGISESPWWGTMAIGAIGLALVVSLVSTPTAYKGFGLVVIWLLAWAFGADRFADSKSVATAIRWLMPIGGAVGAVLIAGRKPLLPGWSAMRHGLRLSGPSRWKTQTTQRLIDFALTIVAGTVLLISTITVSQVLLNGASSLGGPDSTSWFAKISPEISYGLPVSIVVGTFLLFAISERRSWLATIGSAVFQYVVVLAVVLLFISPHPKLASSWFINILKAVSLGMTGYGFAWCYWRERIEGLPVSQRLGSSNDGASSAGQERTAWPSQIEVHTLINGLLITSLAALAMGRFYLVPDQPGDWISTVGSPLGVLAWAAFGILAYSVWRESSIRSYAPSTATWVWLAGWMGLILVGLSSAVIDRSFGDPDRFVAWRSFGCVMIGAVIVSLGQTGLIAWLNHQPIQTGASSNASPHSDPGYDTVAHKAAQRTRQSLAWPVLLTGSIAMAYAVRGAWLDPASFWIYLGVITVLTVLTTVIGWMLRDGKLSFVSAAIASVGVSLFVWRDPAGWFSGDRPDWMNLIAISLGLISAAWVVFYLLQTQRSEPDIPPQHATGEFPRSFLWLPNIVMLGGPIWVMILALLQLVDRSTSGSIGLLDNPLGVTTLLVMVGLAGLFFWNDRAKFIVFAWCAISLSLAIAIPSVATRLIESRTAGVMMGMALAVCFWGVAWLNREKGFNVGNQLKMKRLDLLEQTMRIQLPVYSILIGGMTLLVALGVIFNFELRLHRYLAALVPFAIAIGLGTQSNQTARRWLQILTLLLVTLGVLFLGWADLSRAQMQELPMIRMLVRSLIVLAGAMFVYGGLVTRWVREGDSWLKSLREMAVVTCALAIGCLVLVLISEASSFTEGQGCGLAIAESATVAILVAGMIAGLIVIALRPENDPFALSLSGRMGYVYAAEFVGLAWIAHLYFSMPFLFQFGIKAYWPYLVMAICFGGVGIAQVLEKRKLTVLGRPLFNTAVVLPLIVAFAIFAIDSKAQAELVMLTVGLVYLMISYTHKSILSGLAAIVFGNLALWMVFNKAEFSFFDHPQLWLIPPAVSTLVAGQFSRKQLSAGQLATLRYICVIVIYVSSTMEVFISGIGDNLWPPVILAILSVIGIMSGIMFRVKSFLYFGSLFLLMAMITMVAHAHQALHHVWPWWAFGIGLGIAILVMFGLFEKKKNEMKALTASLKQWEA